jgi:hypothetical protein
MIRIKNVLCENAGLAFAADLLGSLFCATVAQVFHTTYCTNRNQEGDGPCNASAGHRHFGIKRKGSSA